MTTLSKFSNSNIRKLKNQIKVFDLLKKSKFKKIEIIDDCFLSIGNNKINIITEDINFFDHEISNFSYCDDPNTFYFVICLFSIEKIENTEITMQYNFKLNIPENKSCKICLPDYSKWKFKDDAIKVNFDNSLKEFFYKNRNLKFSFKKSSYIPDWLSTILVFS